MAVQLNRIDSAPVINQDFSFFFSQWLSILVDSLNQIINTIQNSLNLLQAQSYTSAQISTLYTGGSLANGVILYDTNLNVYVGVQNGALIKFIVSAYP